MSSRDKNPRATTRGKPATTSRPNKVVTSRRDNNSNRQQPQPTTSLFTATNSKRSSTIRAPSSGDAKTTTKTTSKHSQHGSQRLASSSSLTSKRRSQVQEKFEECYEGTSCLSEMDSSNLSIGEQISSKNTSDNHSLIVQETNVDMDKNDPTQDTDDDESSTLLESCSSPVKVTTPKQFNDSVQKRFNPLPEGWEQYHDKTGPYYWQKATGFIQRDRPKTDSAPLKQSDPPVLYHDDEEINQASIIQKVDGSDEDDYLESGAALTIADDPTLVDNNLSPTTDSFVVYPLGCCRFDETHFLSASCTKAIQKCILRLANKPTKEESTCWGLDQSQPILMKLIDNLIEFTDLKTNSILRSQPIPTIKTWAVDDDNNFAFVVEDSHLTRQEEDTYTEDANDSVDFALLSAPTYMCYVFRSLDDDDMSCKVATRLNDEMNRHKEQLSDKITQCTRLKQMIEPTSNDLTDADEDSLDHIEEGNEITMEVKYIGKTQVSRPNGVDTLNAAIDRCLIDASRAQTDRLSAKQTSVQSSTTTNGTKSTIDDERKRTQISNSPLIDAKLHISPSSVIVEDETTGEIIVECRIRYLTFIGISRRDIRWCGFIMQNTTNKTFVAHCFECYPTAGRVCEAIQASCMKMYEKVVKNHQLRQSHGDDVTSIIPKSSKIRDTLAKTLSRIRLNPIL